MTDINKYVPFREGTYPCFVAVENKCKYEAKNPNKKDVRQFKIDGEVFSTGNKQLRCDWLILNDTDRHAYYIELKGSDIPHAIEQIEATIQMISPSIPDYQKTYRRIVYKTGTHKIQESSVIKWKKKHPDAIVKHLTYSDDL